jgi:hypothetical protein
MFHKRKPGRRRRTTAAGKVLFLSGDRLAGVAAIGPGEVPQSIAGYPPVPEYSQLCSLLSRARLTDLGGTARSRIDPRPQGYALLAMRGTGGQPLTVITEETAKARSCQEQWATGTGDGHHFLMTTDTVVAVVDGWPVPTIANPHQ